MGARTDTARAQVVAAREELAGEVTRLEAAGRSAVDVPAKIRHAPAKTAGLAAGAAFLVLGGPKRLFRRARRAIVGPQADLPKSMLPAEVDKALRKLGPDGEKVRATLEREFSKYLEAHKDERENRDLGTVAAVLLANVARPLTERAGRRLAGQLFSPENASFQDALERIRARGRAGKGTSPEEPASPARPAKR